MEPEQPEQFPVERTLHSNLPQVDVLSHFVNILMLVYVPNPRGDPAPRNFPATHEDFMRLDARTIRSLLVFYELSVEGAPFDLQRRLAAAIGARISG
jgi:hypothetical protein